MTELRKRMIESLQLRVRSERTQEAHVRAVRQLAQHFQKSPDLVSEEELRQSGFYRDEQATRSIRLSERAGADCGDLR